MECTHLQDVDLPVVHVLQELLEVLRPDVLEEDDGVLVRLPREHLRGTKQVLGYV